MFDPHPIDFCGDVGLAFPLFLSLLGVTGTRGESGDTLYVCARSDNAKASTSQHQDSLFRQPIRELKLPPLRPLIYEAALIPPGAEVLADRSTYLLQLWRLLSNPIKRQGIEPPFGGNLCLGLRPLLRAQYRPASSFYWRLPFTRRFF